MIKVIIPIFLFFLVGNIYSQEVIVTTSETEKSKGLQISWTIGQPFTEFHSNGISLSQGMSESNLMVTSVNNYGMDIENIKAFPNPTADIITIQINNPENKTYLTKVYNLT